MASLEEDKDILKTIRGLLRAGKDVKFAFIHAEKANHSIKALGANLEVSRQGSYAWRARPPSPRVTADAALCAAVREVFEASNATYGSPRVRRELRARGCMASKRAVERAMRAMGLTPPAPRSSPHHDHR